MSVTIKDIAKEANVSFSTVSKALNDSPLVKEPTKQRILSLAKEMGYEINTSAKILATGRSNAVGIYCPEIPEPRYSAYVQEVSRQLKLRGFLPAVATSSFDDAKELFSRLKASCVLVVDQDEIHFPNIDFTYNPFSDTSDYTFAGQKALKKDAALKAASLLVHSGHRSVLIINEHNDEWLYSLIKRENKFETIHHLPIHTGDPDRFYTNVKAVLDHTMPDVIICSTRKLAEFTLLVSKSLNLHIPEECSLIAYDENTDVASPVSLFGYSTTKAAEIAADYVLSRTNQQKEYYVNLKPEMVINQTIKL